MPDESPLTQLAASIALTALNELRAEMRALVKPRTDDQPRAVGHIPVPREVKQALDRVTDEFLATGRIGAARSPGRPANPLKHGTSNAYGKPTRCRCELCVEHHNDYARAYKLKHPEIYKASQAKWAAKKRANTLATARPVTAVETVDEFQARGGQITRVEPGDGRGFVMPTTAQATHNR